jgi:hypothetical protein
MMKLKDKYENNERIIVGMGREEIEKSSWDSWACQLLLLGLSRP